MFYDNKGIEICKKNMFADILAVLYYGKAFAEYRLEKTEYKKSLDLSLQLCKIFEQIELMKQIIVNCEDVLGIDMSEYK